MMSKYPNGLPVSDSLNIYYVPFTITMQDDQSSATTAQNLVTNLVGGSSPVDFVFNAQPSFALQEATTVSG